jgi:hypothetical protein
MMSDPATRSSSSSGRTRGTMAAPRATASSRAARQAATTGGSASLNHWGGVKWGGSFVWIGWTGCVNDPHLKRDHPRLTLSYTPILTPASG